MKLLCGASRTVITPPVGTLLYGYRPDVVSTSVHDDLTLTAVAFTGALLVSVSVGDIQNELSNELRQEAAKESGIPAENILLCATHTHSAPNVSGMEGWGEIDRAYVDGILLPALKQAAKQAVAEMVPAEVGYAVGESRVGINRREHSPEGGISLGQNPWGNFDPNMTVMAIRNAETRKGIVNLIHYGCHGTACGCGHEITRDWMGGMTDRLENLTGVLTVFFNGAIGDVGPRLTNLRTVGDITHVEELGSVAAGDAVRIYRQIRAFSPCDVKLYHGTVRLPYQSLTAKETVDAELASIKEPEKLINISRLRYRHLCDMKAIWDSGNTEKPDDFSYAQTIIAVGDTVFIPFPYELFSEISLRLRAYSGYQNTLCLSCANGYEGYLPSEDQLCRGGYEVGVFRYASPWCLADNTDTNIIRENLRILEKR